MPKKTLGPAEDGPPDEMLLAEMIAGARGNDLGFAVGSYYQDAAGNEVDSVKYAARCCAFGALALTRGKPPTHLTAGNDLPFGYGSVIGGNDGDDAMVGDSGWNVGAAYRSAMIEQPGALAPRV